MEVAALIIAVLALVVSVASLAVQFTLLLNKAKEQSAVSDPLAREATPEEIEAFIHGNEPARVRPTNPHAAEVIKKAQDAAFNESFESPDYSGIDEEFNL